MACDPNTLLEQAKCINACIPAGMMPAVNTALLCQILSSGGDDMAFTEELLNGLIHYWKLDESAGSQRLDSIGSLNLTETNGPVPSVVGKHNSAAQVEVTYLESSAWLISSPFSVSIWLKFDSHLFDGWTAVSKMGAVSEAWMLRISDIDVPRFRTGLSFGAGAVDPLSLGDYHLLVGTYDGNFLQLSVDGSNFFISPPGETSDAGSGTLSLVDNSGNFLHELDELAIWNRVLTQQEVTSLWNNGNGRFLA